MLGLAEETYYFTRLQFSINHYLESLAFWRCFANRIAHKFRLRFIRQTAKTFHLRIQQIPNTNHARITQVFRNITYNLLSGCFLLWRKHVAVVTPENSIFCPVFHFCQQSTTTQVFDLFIKKEGREEEDNILEPERNQTS